MALAPHNYPDPTDPNNPRETAYAWASNVLFDMAGMSGSVTLNVNPNEAAWMGRPLDQITVYFGADLGGQTPMPTLTELMSDPEFAAAFNVVGLKIYAAIKTAHPLFATADIV